MLLLALRGSTVLTTGLKYADAGCKHKVPDTSACSWCGSMDTVECDSKGLTAVPMGIPVTVYTLDLSANKITRIDKAPLDTLTGLSTIDATANQITLIEENAFAELVELAQLHLDSNQLTAVEPYFWGAPQSLQIISLKANAGLRDIRKHAWSRKVGNSGDEVQPLKIRSLAMTGSPSMCSVGDQLQIGCVCSSADGYGYIANDVSTCHRIATSTAKPPTGPCVDAQKVCKPSYCNILGDAGKSLREACAVTCGTCAKETQALYIRISHTTDPIGLTQVQVFDSKGTPVEARNAVMSSTHDQNVGDYSAGRCIDGDVRQSSRCQTQKGDTDPWLRIRVEVSKECTKVEQIAKIVVHNYLESSGHISGATIAITTDVAGTNVVWSDKFHNPPEARYTFERGAYGASARVACLFLACVAMCICTSPHLQTNRNVRSAYTCTIKTQCRRLVLGSLAVCDDNHDHDN